MEALDSHDKKTAVSREEQPSPVSVTSEECNDYEDEPEVMSFSLLRVCLYFNIPLYVIR
jgi:hypothetical protein